MKRVFWLTLPLGFLLLAGAASSESPMIAPHSEISSRDAGPFPDTRTLEDWYAMGGPVMHLLSFCSILVLGICLERAWRLRHRAILPKRVMRALDESPTDSGFSELRSVCASNGSALSRLIESGLDAEDPLERLAETGRGEAQRLHRNLPLLAALANIATMLGLLGTVLGMIEAFELIAGTGTGDAKVVASGIFRALVTTAAGLGVGIAALSMHALFSRRADSLTHELEDVVGRFWGTSDGSSGPSEHLAVRAVN